MESGAITARRASAQSYRNACRPPVARAAGVRCGNAGRFPKRHDSFRDGIKRCRETENINTRINASSGDFPPTSNTWRARIKESDYAAPPLHARRPPNEKQHPAPCLFSEVRRRGPLPGPRSLGGRLTPGHSHIPSERKYPQSNPLRNMTAARGGGTLHVLTRFSTIRSIGAKGLRPDKSRMRNGGGCSLKIREEPIRHSREACLPRALRGIGTDVRQTRARTEDENKDTGRNPIPFEKRTYFPGIPTKHDICRIFPTEQKNEKHEKHNVQKRRPDASFGARNMAGTTR